MARQPGSAAQLAATFETTYGTAPASGYRLMPFVSESLGTDQPLLASDLLGQGRDPAPPVRDVQTTDGDVTIPLDVENLGFWLKALMGQPTTTGTAPNRIHTFTSGAATLPSFAAEVQMPQVPFFQMFTGCMVNEMSFTMGTSGLLTGTARIMGQGSARAATSSVGTTTAYAMQRFGNFNASIQRNGTSLASITSATVTYSNTLDTVRTIRADGRVDGFDPGMAMLSGSFTARFADTVLIDQAVAGTPCELIFGHSLGANASWSLTAHAVYLPLPRIGVSGPTGVEATFAWQAARATTPARMATAVLNNSITSY